MFSGLDKLVTEHPGDKPDPGGVPVTWGGGFGVGCQTLKVAWIGPGFPGHRHINKDSQDSKEPWLINNHNGRK